MQQHVRMSNESGEKKKKPPTVASRWLSRLVKSGPVTSCRVASCPVMSSYREVAAMAAHRSMPPKSKPLVMPSPVWSCHVTSCQVKSCRHKGCGYSSTPKCAAEVETSSCRVASSRAEPRLAQSGPVLSSLVLLPQRLRLWQRTEVCCLSRNLVASCLVASRRGTSSLVLSSLVATKSRLWQHTEVCRRSRNLVLSSSVQSSPAKSGLVAPSLVATKVAAVAAH